MGRETRPADMLSVFDVACRVGLSGDGLPVLPRDQEEN